MTFLLATPIFTKKIARALARVLIGLLMLSHALFAFSSATSLSHAPLRATTHSHAGATTDQYDHGHSHDDFEDEGGPHQHGHNAADHSHDKPNVPPTHAIGVPPLSNQWIAEERRPAYPAPCATLERPPKRLLIV
ncbi:hypothetical protein [Thauera chlorobenzoica]|uniref:Uncharacterized protein n=1 Tax=Thauera chlorobenzoica TaxID=96773 RepID=A0A1H5V8M5_9RHOO|nr:hypothetical protein [Thauera chlorobenzoica]APR02939.1 hypothetical protein Tchl_0063 [Thauera chlorobenzoica]SEF83128.1 hypothetical protein SAMN05216242_10726 [Thauera chlorobenzoica]